MKKGVIVVIILAVIILAGMIYVISSLDKSIIGLVLRGQDQARCYDSDADYDADSGQRIVGGKEYFKPGYVYVNTEIPLPTFMDKCLNTNVLEEQYCANKTSRAYIRYKCEFGCDITRACRTKPM